MVAATDNRWAQRAYTGLAPELRKAKQGILLGTDIELDGDLVGVRLRSPLEPLGLPGRGFLVSRGAAEVVQLALAPNVRDSAAGTPEFSNDKSGR